MSVINFITAVCLLVMLFGCIGAFLGSADDRMHEDAPAFGFMAVGSGLILAISWAIYGIVSVL